MRTLALLAAVATVGLAAAPALAQAPAASPAAVRAIAAGTYNVDPNHTIVTWSVDHMGFSRLSGMVGEMKGVLRLDPARPEAASVEIDIPLSGLRVTSPAFSKHLATGDLFDTAKFPTARFVSRSVKVNGLQAQITGDLTLRGVTRPVVLDTRFYGAGPNPMTKAATVGFAATGKLKRSEFGLGYAVPAVSDEVTLEIDAAFEKAPG